MVMLSRKAVTEKLLNDPQPASQLQMVDAYIDQRKKMGTKFVLPKEHSHLKPLIDHYQKDLDSFVDYVRDIRDDVPPRGNTYISLHELYRTLRVRRVQQERRARGRRALDWLEKNYPKATIDQKMRWLRKLEQQWGKDRFHAMDVARDKIKGADRLTTDEREDVLNKFWADVDNDIKKGNLPPL